jgi:anti-sigma factor RsiW
MPCQHYKEALIEAAASGSEPQGELRAHLDACANCRAAFEQEQLLFVSVDAGLRVSANAEVPASLLPRVRARLGEESVPRYSWFTNRIVLASAAVIVVAFFAARAVWRPNTVQSPVESIGKTSAPPQVTPSLQTHEAVVVSPVEKNAVSQRKFAISKNTSVHETQVKGKTMPEVLVPRDQEVLLAKYAEQWSLRKRAPLLLAHNSDSTVLEPLQVPPIQIAELDVKPLAEEISQ